MTHTQLRSNGNAPNCSILGRRFQSCSVDAGSGAAAMLAAPGFEPPTKKFAAACITIRPLVAETRISPHCLDQCLPLTKNPKCVFLSD